MLNKCCFYLFRGQIFPCKQLIYFKRWFISKLLKFTQHKKVLISIFPQYGDNEGISAKCPFLMNS